MNYRELLRLAINSLRANKLRSMLTTLGIIIGVFAVILLVSIGSGLQAYITNQISGLGSNLIFVVPGSANGSRTAGGVVTNKLIMNDAKNLETKLKGVADVSAIVQSSANLKYKNKQDKRASVIGVSASYPAIIKTDLISGAFFTGSQVLAGSHVTVIGQTVLLKLFPNENPIGKSLLVGDGRYIVVGILNKKGSVFGMDQDNTVIIPVTIAQRQFGVININGIYISAKQSSFVDYVKKQTQTIMLHRLKEDDFTVQTQEQALSTITSITNILTIALGGIAAISLVVGGIGVMNIMLVSVTERTKEIGLRKALGAKRSDILKQFLLEAVILSLVGGLIGISLGLGASYILAKFFISQVTYWSVFLAFFFSVAVGVIFGITPAIRAARLSPIDALRYE